MKWFKFKKYRILAGIKEGTFIVQYRPNILMPWLGLDRDLNTWIMDEAQQQFCTVGDRGAITERIARHKLIKGKNKVVEYIE